MAAWAARSVHGNTFANRLSSTARLPGSAGAKKRQAHGSARLLVAAAGRTAREHRCRLRGAAAATAGAARSAPKVQRLGGAPGQHGFVDQQEAAGQPEEARAQAAVAAASQAPQRERGGPAADLSADQLQLTAGGRQLGPWRLRRKARHHPLRQPTCRGRRPEWGEGAWEARVLKAGCSAAAQRLCCAQQRRRRRGQRPAAEGGLTRGRPQQQC